uniref:Adenylate kinase 9 n=1 Tax=Oreochromis niloticus TaxID=8128 RepID=I3K723_ORENI
MATLVDNLIEDEAERERLLAKPTCFIIVGRPVIYIIKSVPEDVVLKMILARLNSPDVEHYGYVLSCLPFMSEEHLKINEQIELIKNLKLTPDFIINIKCPDKDLVQRLSVLSLDHVICIIIALSVLPPPFAVAYKKYNPMTAIVLLFLLFHCINQNKLTEITEDLLRIMSSYRIMVPGFRWRRSRWGRTCPVALKEGKVVSGKPQFSVGFQDKLYILSSAEAHHKFVTNPRPYLLPPMPRLPCKVSIIGPSLAGKTTLCKLLAQHYNAAVIDMEELLQPVLVKAKEERIHKIKEETTQAAIDKIKMKMKEDGQNSGKMMVVHDDSELGYTDGPEMNEYKLQLRQFVGEWEKMQSGLTVTHCTLEIGRKSPENLSHVSSSEPFQYVSWELSEEDMEKDAEDIEALAQLERAEEGSDDDYSPGEGNEGDTTTNRFLGDTQHFCPVVLKDHNVLRLCTDEIAAKYREKTYYFSSLEARESFLQNPDQFVAHTEPLKPPALRIFLLGSGGSGKTTNGKWLAQQLGLFHIQFREQLQMLIMAKTKMRIPDADELVLLQDDSEDLDAKIMEARAEDEKEPEDPYDKELTEDEMAIKAYLSDGDPLNPKILDMTIAPYWKHEPYKSTGFILEGFPNDPNEVQYMFEQKFFPDVVVMMEVDVEDVQSRLLPQYLEIWRERRNKREAQLKLLHDLCKKKREDISKRKAELMGEQDLKLSFQAGTKYDEEHETADIEEMIEALLEEEFPAEEDEEDIENEETEELATNRLEIGIKELSFKILMGINASHKLRIVQCQLLKKIKPLLTNRESLFQKCHPIPYSLAYKLLLSSFKFFSAFGFLDPIKLYKERDLIQPLKWPFNTTYPLLFHQYIYFFASKENCNTFMLNPLKYLRQPKPTPSLPIKIAVTGPPKSGKTTVAQIFSQKYGLARLSIGSVMRMVLDTQGNTDLAIQMKEYLLHGLVVPDELAIQCLEVALMNSVCSTQGYVLDGFPMTLKQAELMGSQSIIPMIVVELELDIVEVLKRGLADKMKPHLTHDSSDILHIRNSCYKKEVVHVRHHFQQQYQNCLLLNGLKSKWWIWDRMIKEVSTSMKYIQTYLDRIQRGQAACINKLCITPKEFDCRLGEFGQYCPVCMALHYHLVDISETAALTHAAEYRGHYFKMCDENHLEMFLSTPDQFVTPGCPHTLPKPHLLPRKLTEIQVKNRFPQQVEMKGFCPVTYLDGKQRYEALVRGKMEYAVEYRERIYIFETKEKRDKFMRTPETYWAQKLPIKVPPLSDPVHLTSLPTLGYLEQGVAEAVIKAMTAAGCLKPKHPYLSLKRSALSYVALYLKAFNHKSTDSIRQLYKKKLASFEENCMLIPYLSTVMKGNYRPPSERPIDFEFKLNRFLGLRDLPGANGVQPD